MLIYCAVTSTPLNLTAQQEKDAHSFGLQSPLSVYRTKHIFPPKDRSKLIIDPLRVTMQGIHCPQYLVRGQEVKVVDPEVALLHHYRSWRRQAKVKDTSAVRFAPRLIENVRKAWKELGVS
ncbi:hypothetical protein BaRGS_00028657 [Batillaria attramentaria]|uniref:Glycosyltransferase family 92 protein n=1 Tax=Batillaria attramentaria TaxID=370345 RepID=A0ABD0JYE9_9CAEN